MSKFSYSKEKFIGRQPLQEKLIISNSNKIQPLLISASSLKKREPSKRHTKTNQI